MSRYITIEQDRVESEQIAREKHADLMSDSESSESFDADKAPVIPKAPLILTAFSYGSTQEKVAVETLNELRRMTSLLAAIKALLDTQTVAAQKPINDSPTPMPMPTNVSNVSHGASSSARRR